MLELTPFQKFECAEEQTSIDPGVVAFTTTRHAAVEDAGQELRAAVIFWQTSVPLKACA
jgi:hypothetical protein